jgi:protein subunit release factor A
LYRKWSTFRVPIRSTFRLPKTNSELQAELEAKDNIIQALQNELQALEEDISEIKSKLQEAVSPPEPPEPKVSYPSHYEINGRTHCPHCGVKYLDLVYFGAQGCDKCPWP